MTDKMDPAEIMDLRERARQILRDRTFDGTLDAFERGDLDLARLLEELHIYHAELYLQQVALHESQRANERALARFTRLYRELPFPALLISWQGFLKEANAAAQRLLPLDRRLFSHLAADGQAFVLENALMDARDTGRADCREVHLRGHADRPLIVDLRLIRLPEVDGDEPELVCNLVDQTEQVAARDDLITANRRLRIQEERYHIIADFAPDWAYWIGEDGRFRYVSPACGRISGYPAAAFIKDPELFMRIIHPDDRHLYHTHLHEEVSKAGPTTLRFRIYTRTGDLRWIEHLCQRVTGPNGQPLGHRGSNLDITDKVALETALTRGTEVIDASSAVAFHWMPEPGWPIAYASANVRRWGYPIARFLARELTYLDIVHPRDRDRLVDAFESFRREQRDVFLQTYRVLWADGSEHWVDEETRCVHDSNGRIAHFHGIVIDVSERERAKRALKSQLRLQSLVVEISSRLVNAHVDEIREVVDRVLERIGRFFKAGHCYLLRFSDDSESMDVAHAWCADGIQPLRAEFRDLAFRAFPWWAKQLRASMPVQIPDIRELPPEAAAERVIFEHQSIRSLLSLPMTSHGQAIGALAMHRMTQGAPASEDELRVLQIVAGVIAGSLVRIASETERVEAENSKGHPL
jgi:PAS domain S-box-containing protein